MRSVGKSIALIAALSLMQLNVSLSQWAFDTAISVGMNTTGIAITSDGRKVVATNNTNPGSVVILSTSNFTFDTVNVSGIENYPNAVAIAPNDSVALVCTTHKVIFIDLYSHVIKGSFTAPCAGTTLYGIAVTSNGVSGVFPDLSSTCTQQGVRIIDATGQSSASNFIQVTTTGELYGIAMTPNGSSALVTTYSSDTPKLVNLSAGGVQSIAGMSGSYGVAMLHNGAQALVFDGDSLDLVSLTTYTIVKKISPLTYNTSFQNIAVTQDDKYAFVVGAFEKLIVSLATDSVVQTFTAGGTNVAADSAGSAFYVTDSYNGAVRVYKRQSTSGVSRVKEESPSTYSLQQNYPNPFNPTTSIQYSIPKESHVVLAIFDELGRKVATLVNADKSAGNYRVTFNASNLSSGTYFYRFQAGSYTETKKLVLLK